jgi:exopolysaccharide biosynthesis protein
MSAPWNSRPGRSGDMAVVPASATESYAGEPATPAQDVREYDEWSPGQTPKAAPEQRQPDAPAPSTPPQSSKCATLRLAGVSALVATVPVSAPNIKVSVACAQNMPDGSEPFSDILSRCSPAVAVAGTFFCKSTLSPIGDIVINGDLKHFGGMGTALAITADRRVRFIRVPWGRHVDWSNYEGANYVTVLAAGPQFIRGRVVDLDARAQGFTDSHVLGAACRTAVGWKRAGNTLFLVAVRSPVTLGKLADMCQELGVDDALNLDGGGSLAFFYRGQIVIQPGRQLTNLLVAYDHA